MIALQTEVKVHPGPFFISHKEKVFLLGSCFSDNIGAKLEYFKFQSLSNPFGIAYNPISLNKVLQILVGKQKIGKDHFFYHRERWQSFLFHGDVSSDNLDALVCDINEKIAFLHNFLSETDYLFLTWGSAWVYLNQDSDEIVANCHKVESKKFRRRLLGLEEIVGDFQNLLTNLLALNPKLQIIFTVSPVRHWRDGAEENQLSKSTLFVALYELIHRNRCISYFPSYEIVMDELRDYRFYNNDMLHPSNQAIDIIWEKFANKYMDSQSQVIISKIKKMRGAMEHRPFNRNSQEHQKFLQTEIARIEKLQQALPYISFARELNYFKDQVK